MTQQPFDERMSLALDGLLSEDERRSLNHSLSQSPEATDAWERMRVIDRMLDTAPEASPPFDFARRVMARIEAFDTRRRWRPWIISLLVLVTTAAVISIMLPIGLLVLGGYRWLLSVPMLGDLISMALDALGQAQAAVLWLGESVLRWITFVTTDPVALTTVVSALVVASIWIGLREAFRLAPLSVDG